MDPIEAGKNAAAQKAVDTWVSSDMVLGIGSGSTVVYAVERLSERIKEEGLSNIICIPTSFQSRQLIVEHKLTLGDLNRFPNIDVDIDGADEIDAQLNLIKGGGGCHLQEKIIAACAKKLIIIADERKDSHFLGENWKKGVPLEVYPGAYQAIMNQITTLGGTPSLRMAQAKAGPVVTDNGNFLIDADFGIIEDPASLNAQLIRIPGILETGLFVGMADKAYIGTANGEVKEI